VCTGTPASAVKAGKDGAVAQVLEYVATLRLECEPDWEATTDLRLKLLIVVEPEHLPSSPVDDIAPDSTNAEVELVDVGEAADRVLKADAYDPLMPGHWERFGRALLAPRERGRDAAPGVDVDADH
jgi:hypothetical protein